MALLEGSRDQVRELGNFESLFGLVCKDGPEDLDARPMGPYGSAYIYIIDGKHIVMWIAVCPSKRQAAVVKWMQSTTDILTQQEAAAAAVVRAEHLFP